MRKSFWLNGLRWVAFLPAALLAAALARILNYWGARYLGIYPEEGGLLASLFVAYSDIIESAAMVAGGAFVAPAGRPIVAAVIATLHTGFWSMLLIIELSINRVLASETRPGILFVLIGSVIGAIAVHQEEKKRSVVDLDS